MWVQATTGTPGAIVAEPPPIEESLRGAGVSLHIVRVDGQPTGTAFICVSDDAENAIAVAPGANGALEAAHLPPLDGVPDFRIAGDRLTFNILHEDRCEGDIPTFDKNVTSLVGWN